MTAETAEIPDLERIASDHLRARSVRAVGKTPDVRDAAWVRVTQLDASQNGSPDHLVSFLLQFDCYAGETGGQPEAVQLGRTVRALLGDLPGVHGTDVVTGVEITTHARVADTDLEPARERVIVTAEIWAHA